MTEIRRQLLKLLFLRSLASNLENKRSAFAGSAGVSPANEPKASKFVFALRSQRYVGRRIRFSKSVNRGSERSGSYIGSVLTYRNRYERSAKALSSQPNAWSLSPRAVY